MNRILKTLLLWLIVVALPIQATAAVIKASCGSAHHAMLTTMHEQDIPVHEHDHSVMAMHEHHAHAAYDGVDGMSAADIFSGQDIQEHSSCSACAACCVGAVAPPSAAVQTPEFTSFETAGVASATLIAGFIPASPERPPRFFLA